jgi:hypothetical protein
MRRHGRGMNAEFTIKVEPECDLVRVECRGFFRPADVERFAAERVGALRLLRCAPKDHLAISDIRNLTVFAQDTLEALSATINDPALQARRLAVVAGSSLLSRQLKRLSESQTLAVFLNYEDAEKWLFERRI